MKKLLLAFAVLPILFFTACTSRPELVNYPRTQIERPFTLSAGVSTWEIPSISVVNISPSSITGFPPIPVPLFWNTALSDTWTLHWLPLPLGISHQLPSYAKNQFWGFSFGMGGGYSTSTGGIIAPSGSLYHRYPVSSNIALVTIPSLFINYLTNNGRTTGNVALKFGSMFQVHPHIALAFYLQPKYVVGPRTADGTGGNSAYFLLPVSGSAQFSLSRQWDMDIDISADTIGGATYNTIVSVITFRHFW